MPATSAETILTVGAKSNPNSVAGAITNQIKEFGRSYVRAIGSDAVNQANKAIAISRGQLASTHVDVIMIPGFVEVLISGETKTALQYIVEPR